MRVKIRNILVLLLLGSVIVLFSSSDITSALAPAPENPQSGSVGLQGKIPTPAPTQGATITIPSNGQVFTNIPINVSGLCPTGLLVKVFKNNVFAGAVQCNNGSYTLQIDLFSGANELVARVYDALDQAGPESNKPVVTFNDSRPGAGSRVALSSIYAKRGAKPGDTLVWPIILTGGRGPYAISVDWGDGKTPDLKSLLFAGNFDIQHIYDNAGVYNIIIKATDADGVAAFLQLVGIGNGDPTQSTQKGGSSGPGFPIIKIIWEPAALAIPLLISTFWLGKRYEYRLIKKQIRRGENPFTK